MSTCVSLKVRKVNLHYKTVHQPKSDMAKEASDYYCRAHFIYHHGQKPSLTLVTPATMSSVLHRIYPLLLIADATLSNLMWICEDLCLPFIHLVMVLMVVNFLCEDLQVDISHIAQLWLGLMSLFFLAFSVAYYILTLYQDLLYESEPPTVDDIVIVLESVVDKLETIQHEGLSVNKRRALQLAVLLTPLHWGLIKLVSMKNYCMGFTLMCILYHSNWFQCTLKLFWRILLTRKVYYGLERLFNGHGPFPKKPVDFFRAISSSEYIYRMALPHDVKALHSHKLQLRLQQLFPWDKPLHNDENGSDLMVIEFKINENQRKWQADGWTARMLPYERTKYSIELGGKINTCHSPWQFQESDLKNWSWLDDCWRPTDWIYSDTNWDFKGVHDSLDCCTRTRAWKRRVYRLME
ncbi:hypothetical protein ZYGR_0A04630 [Zygosaccharomyces rouxii]|uniref:ZYRO0A10472p n=2 Tax=Zygosaccharomyces rouxii TaxID=4956 RepID=C5DQC9_ZYGRC|nr:uncharacterized protein ZYRO0A10472g [Zygosaccharomyces rouxii]KAH9198591.1 Peroxin/Dysferlin domain-containing protein [Zygosaccharomyces rouxii]GAV46865.1 hypothetical protein ZYGR_0A04630 [Zygosaccharomyces rouxii]CAR25890.1 ZYRO0A10472p [Zygosaccharomyces rouxii]